MADIIANLTIEDVGIWLATFIGAASFITKAITLVTGITPNTKDDEWASQLTRYVSYAQGILDRLALNPAQHQARK